MLSGMTNFASAYDPAPTEYVDVMRLFPVKVVFASTSWDRECQDTLCNTSEYQMVLYRSFMYRRVPWNQIKFMWYGSWSPPDVLTKPGKICDRECRLATAPVNAHHFAMKRPSNIVRVDHADQIVVVDASLHRRGWHNCARSRSCNIESDRFQNIARHKRQDDIDVSSGYNIRVYGHALLDSG